MIAAEQLMPLASTQEGEGVVADAWPILRRAWMDAARTARENHVPELRRIIEDRLARAAADDQAGEASLLQITDDCQAIVAMVAPDTVADDIGRMLRRGVYEYLLAVDACRHAIPKKAAPGADVEELRRTVKEHLEAGRYDECAALLADVCSRERGFELADVAGGAGRVCRAAGNVAAAQTCFQASCAADPNFEGAQLVGHTA